MKRRMISLLVIVMMVVTMLAGCSGKKTGDDTNTDTSGTKAPTQAAGGNEDSSVTKTATGEYSAENPYHLVFSYIEFYEQDDAARKAVQDALNAKMVPEYHIEVELLPLQYADYQSTIQLMLSGGDALDIIPIFYPYASSWISMGGIYDMSELMATEDGQKIVEALGEANAHVGTMNGVLYGFPANKESVELGGLFMRADICDELGITDEYGLKENEDEYTGKFYDWSVAGEIFAKVKAAHPEMTPLYLYNSSQMNRFKFFDELVDKFGVLDWEADHSSTKVVNMFETDSYKQAVTRLADWYDKGYIYKDAATDTQGTATMMKAGNTFSYATAIKPGFLAEAQAANACKGYVMYFNDHKEGGISTTNVSFFNTGIATNSMDPEMAFKFVSALYSDAEVMNLWQYGIQDVNYKLLEDGTAYFVDGEDGANYKYHQNTGWFMGNQFISYVWNDGTKTADYWNKLQKHNDWAEYSPAFGFMWDSTDYSTEITALNNALDTYRSALETGSVGSANVDSTLKKLNDALYAAGLQDVMDAKQKQLDEWLASK
ncbi:MAG TPA: ABC transporter substrate-binding protein [Clostridiales bacterium]|nr:ABC transporter substrate-binding protein [Clostridiales bacterium]